MLKNTSRRVRNGVFGMSYHSYTLLHLPFSKFMKLRYPVQKTCHVKCVRIRVREIEKERTKVKKERELNNQMFAKVINMVKEGSS